MQQGVMGGATGGGGATEIRRCVYVCVPAEEQAVWIPWQPLVTLPSDHLGPLSYPHSLHQWELVWQWRRRGAGRAADASFSTFLSPFLRFTFPPFFINPSFLLFLRTFAVLPSSAFAASWHLFTSFSLWQTHSHMLSLTSTAALERRYRFNTAAGPFGSKTVHQGLVILPLQYVAWRWIDKKLRSWARKDKVRIWTKLG